MKKGLEGQRPRSLHVVVVGAGAMGSLLGARLLQSGSHVVLLDVDIIHIDAIRKEGLRILELDGTETRFHPKAAHQSQPSLHVADLVVVMVKSYATERALDLLHPSWIGPDTLFLSLQNGLGNGEILADLVGPERILLGVTAQGATKEGPGVVRHGGNGPTFIGSLTGRRPPGIDDILHALASMGDHVRYRDDIHFLIWEKLMVNIGINAITALCSVPNLAIARFSEARALAESAVREALAVAEAEGFSLTDETVLKVFEVAHATGPNRSSMLQDIDNARKTEIDAINGAVVQRAERHGIPVPVNQTLVNLIKIKERAHEFRSAQS